MDESAFLQAIGEERFEEFEIADGGGVEDERIGTVKPGGAVEMAEGGFLSFARVVKDGGGGSGGEGVGGEAAAIEAHEMEVLLEGALRVVEAEDPIVERGETGLSGGRGWRGGGGKRISLGLRASRAAGRPVTSSSVARNSPVERST